MFYISRDNGRRIFIPHPTVELKNTNKGSVAVGIPQKWIWFKPIAGDGYVTNALPNRDGRNKAEGFFESDNSRFRRGLTEEEADEFLMNHKDYGVDFVAMVDGRAINPLEWDDPAHRSGPFLTDSGAGKQCSRFDKQVDIRGLHKHIESKAHLGLLLETERSMRMRAVG